MDEEIKKEQEDWEAKANEYLNNWKRAAADFANYKKDESERMAQVVRYEREAMLLGVLQVLDSIYLAEKHIPEHLKQEQWMEGFGHIKRQMEDLLKKEGVQEIDISGNGFDPSTMEIIEEVGGGESGKIAEETQKGYKIGDKVIRPAKVKVCR